MILAPVGTGRGSITGDKCEKTLVGCVVITPSSHLVGVEENEKYE